MKHATNCKFCKRPITIDIDDSYERDPFKLIPMAACNHCADCRVDRRRLEFRLSVMAGKLHRMRREDRDSYKQSIERLTQDYARMIARWHNREGMAWDEEVVNWLIEKPEEWAQIANGLWKFYQHSTQTTNA